MCCRCYVEYLKDEELRKYYNLCKDKENIKIEGEIFPTDNMVVIAKDKNNNISSFKMKWGYNIKGVNVFNARVETIETNTFSDGIKRRRCVIPVSNYFEWDKNKKKYRLKDEGSVTYLLGVYRFEENTPVFSIITKEATESMKGIHDRMPVALKKEMIVKWIEDDINRNSYLNSSIERFLSYEC